MTKDTPQTTDVAIRRTRQPAPHLINPAPLPPELDGLFYIQAWIKSLTTRAPYVEPNPDYMAQRMAMLTLSATTIEELTAEQALEGLQKLIPDEPYASTGPILITDLYVAASDMAEGNPTYMLLTWINEETGVETVTSTGATTLQLQFASLLAMGVWPIRGQIRRGSRKDKGGRYLLGYAPVE